MKDPYLIVLAPVITETSMNGQAYGKYTFKVALNANKIEIARAIEEIAKPEKVNVTKVNTLIVKGEKRRSLNRRDSGKTPDWKKAIVTLAPGQVIRKFEGV
jgi:large subunit ribosomal protein L23